MGLAGDVRYALRRFQRAPGFVLAIVLCLGLGLGATAGVFSFFFGIVLRPLPFPDPDRLVVLFETAPSFTRASPTNADFEGWRENATAFSALGGYGRARRTLTGVEGPEILEGTRVSHDLFGVLGIQPHLGREFTRDDDGPGAPPSVILSHRIWESRYGGRRDLIGSVLFLDEEPHTVLGVMPPGFAFPEEAAFWIPLRTSAAPGGGQLTAALGRMRDGVTLEATRRDMARVGAIMREMYPEANAEREVAVHSLEEDFLWGLKTPVTLFLLVAGFVLLLSLANVANLLLAQAATREREMVVRSALGAARPRIVRQLLVESVLLAAMAGGIGLVLGVLGRNLYLSFLPEAFPYYLSFDLDGPVMGLLALVTLGAGVLFGLAPALEASRIDLFSALRGGSGGAGDGSRGKAGAGRNLRSGLMAVQTAVALAVLVGAGMMAESLGRLRQNSPGLDSENLLTAQVALSGSYRDDTEQQRMAFEEIRRRVAALPGVISASAVSNLPIAGAAAGTSLYAEGTEAPPPGQEPWVINKTILPGYFETMGIQLVAGRGFREEDGAEGTGSAVIVNEAFARRHWPGENPLGKRIKYGRPESEFPWMEVVGVAADVRHFGLDRPVELGIYEPLRRWPYWRETLVARTSSDPMSLVGSVRQALSEVDPGAPLYGIMTMEEALYRSHWRPVVLSRLLWVFSGVALVLAVLGVFGVVAFSTARRTREYGVRMALGASSRTIVGAALRQAFLPCAAGLAVGLGLAYGGIRVASSLMYGVETLDPVVAGGALSVLTGVVLGAVLLPARRASRVNPAEVLRGD